MKKLKWVAIAFVAAVLIVVFVVFTNLNSIVRTGVERASTQSLGLQTKLDSASVSLFGGSVGLHGLQIASPSGFAAPHFLELGDLKLNVSVSELRQAPIRVSSISLSKPTLVVEQKDMKLNLSAVMDTLPKSDPNAPPPPKLVIGEIKVEGATVVLNPGLPALASPITIPLPDIVVKDIGTADQQQNGVAIKDAMVAVATEMLNKALDSDQVPPELKALLKTDIAGLKAQLGRQLQQVTQDLQNKAQQQLDNVKDQAGKAADDLKKKTKGLGDLLKKP